MKNFLTGTITAFGIALVSPAQAAYEVDIIMPDTPEILGDSKDQLEGSSGRVMKAVLDVIGDKVSHKITDSARAYNAFYKESFACVVPDSKDYYEAGSGYVDSNPIHETVWVAVTQKGTSVTSQDQLLGKTVGIAYEADALLPVVPQEGVKYQVNDDFKLNLKKLAAGRLDVAVLPLGGLEKMIASDSSLSNLHFDASQPLATIGDALMCHDTPRGQEVLKLFNDALGTIDLDKIKAGH